MKKSLLLKINALFITALIFLFIAFGALFWIDRHQQKMQQGFEYHHHSLHESTQHIRYTYHYPWLLISLFVSVLGVGLFLYATLYKSLKPLKIITQEARLMSEGKRLSFDDYRFEDEEIITLAHAIEESSRKLHHLSETRKLMLRNIAHELKTPLTKGRFLSEMVDNSSLKERFETLFIRFESIVNDILNVDTLTSDAVTLQTKQIFVENVIQDAIELLFLETTDNITVEHSPFTLEANYPLFLLACKNLIDNGLKFSTDTSIKVISTPNAIIFENKGTPFSQSFEELLSPFTQEDHSSQGLGLGLYIVQRICEVHGFTFTHKYTDGLHHFSIVYPPHT